MSLGQDFDNQRTRLRMVVVCAVLSFILFAFHARYFAGAFAGIASAEYGEWREAKRNG